MHRFRARAAAGKITRRVAHITPDHNPDLTHEYENVRTAFIFSRVRAEIIRIIDEAIQSARETMVAISTTITEDSTTSRDSLTRAPATALDGLGKHLWTGRSEDLEEAIQVLRSPVLALTIDGDKDPVGRLARRLEDLSVQLLRLYKRKGRAGDLDQAIIKSRRALALTRVMTLPVLTGWSTWLNSSQYGIYGPEEEMI
ncbi:uncharacterized protein N7458_000735 [Penicillium daleae]|uniref:Uncharacterized protein n=1 Tax=Penicillium daleae TaxID=63821 RepID=A0AAD6CGG8_9EURO|nr:uncharacterized protein N7458_000735 [Penicillium daleae]KAJ5465049.1 hypothetical protein N7458_000735 [Penicillium daleae]